MIKPTDMQDHTARVTAVHRDRFLISCAHGEAYARVKTSAFRGVDTLAYPTVGDYVSICYQADGDSQILSVKPRTSLFTRKQAGVPIGEQALAANFDEVFILVSLNRDFNPRRIERYAALAWQSGGTPVVVLSKLDLVEDASWQIFEAYKAAPGAMVYAVSAHTGEGLPALRERLTPGKTIVFLGSSGVGKSSLVNALAGHELMSVGEIREDDARGRHTTTHRQLLAMPSGTYVVDTPGMRELGLWDAEEGMREAFDDIDTLARACRFSDCAHDTEPGCAVKRAITEGTLDARRLQSYHKLQREAARRAKKAPKKPVSKIGASIGISREDPLDS